MGTDIHSVFQKRTPDGWEDVLSAYQGERHYYLFAKLAGVRNNRDDTPIAEPRGLPDDFKVDHGEHPISPEIATDFEQRWNDDPVLTRWMGDHSYSWLLGSEILNSGHEDEDTKYFFDEVRRLHEEHGEVRFVFGFDS